MRNLNRSKKCIQREIQELEARLANRSVSSRLELQAQEMEEEIDKVKQKMVDLQMSVKSESEGKSKTPKQNLYGKGTSTGRLEVAQEQKQS